MDINSFLEIVHGIMAGLCGQSWGSWQFGVLWIAALFELLFFGFVFARGIGKAERSFILIFIGNLISLIGLIAGAALIGFFLGDRIEENWVIIMLMWIAGIWIAFVWVIIFANVLWGLGRIIALVTLCFTLAATYGSMWVGNEIIHLLDKAESSMGDYKEKTEEATEDIKNAISN